MTMTLNNLFSAASATTGSRTLPGTDVLVRIANDTTDNIMKAVDADQATYGPLVIESQTNTDALEKLINALCDVELISIEFLKELDEETLQLMLKSQQSKRSRSKSKEMNIDNYKSMMSASIAEQLIRLALGKERGTSGLRASTKSFTEDALKELAADQDKLRKELRNVQSKKSIMKSKANFDESSDGWQTLLVAEEQLKSIRVTNTPAKVVKVDATREALKEMLAELDPTAMKAADLKELLASVKEMAFADITNEDGHGGQE